MSLLRLPFVAGLLAAGCFLAGPITAGAKGLPAEVTITGPGLQAPLRVTDPFAAASLGTMSFMQADKPLAPPSTGLGSSYEIERDGFDHVLYYPGGSLSDSYVYYEGMFNGSSEYDHHWYLVSGIGDTTIRMLLLASGVQNNDVSKGWSPIANGTLGRASAILADASNSPADGQPDPTGVPAVAWLAYTGVAGLFVGAGLARLAARRRVLRRFGDGP